MRSCNDCGVHLKAPWESKERTCLEAVETLAIPQSLSSVLLQPVVLFGHWNWRTTEKFTNHSEGRRPNLFPRGGAGTNGDGMNCLPLMKPGLCYRMPVHRYLIKMPSVRHKTLTTRWRNNVKRGCLEADIHLCLFGAFWCCVAWVYRSFVFLSACSSSWPGGVVCCQLFAHAHLYMYTRLLG